MNLAAATQVDVRGPLAAAGRATMVAGGRRARRLLALLLVAAVVGAIPGAAAAQSSACPAADPTYTGNCGPTFVLPAWGDAGGWTDPSQYATIQLADVDGDGRDELLGRSDAGIQVHGFDTTVGQWRPQVAANGTPVVLNDFRSTLPSEKPVWTLPQYYTTIQTANIDGQPGEEVLARFPDGMRVYKYTPGPGGGPGYWGAAGTGGPFSDADGWGGDPSLYSTIQTADFDGQPGEELLSRTADGIAVYRWDGANWIEQPTLGLAGNDDGGQFPWYYSDIVTGPNPPWGDQIVTRDQSGVHTAFYLPRSGGWTIDYGPNVFADKLDPSNLQFDCPFTLGSTACFGNAASFWETLQLADVTGPQAGLGVELLGRATDGLRVKTSSPSAWAGTLPTLTALAGPFSTAPGLYGSIQTANLDGEGGREVLALDGTALQAYSYDWQNATWNRLAPSTPLALGSDPWLSDPSIFSTIQAGDVDGDGRDDVIARGPYGIRTWFYNRRGTGGWERYLPEGYPGFATPGQQAAFAELNNQAQARGVIPATAATLRDVWAGENAPQPSDLAQLQQGLLSLADCVNENPGDPPSYKSCTAPAGSSGFTAADWTAVVNEMLAEIFWAQQVVAHFAQVDGLRQSLFISENAELPAIGSDLELQAAADAQVAYNLEQQFADVFDIIGAIAGLIPEGGGVLSAIFSVTGDILSMLPSSSNTLTSSFDTTYSGLQAQFANSVSEVDKALAEHSQDVRQDLGLLSLVGQLRARGTWQLDEVGAASAGRQGFALWAYQTLMPAIYSRYEVSNCITIIPNWQTTICSGPSGGLGVIYGGQNFITLSPVPVLHSLWGTPCGGGAGPGYDCQYDIPPSALREILWGDVSPQCAYQPGNPNTAWTFGCALGVAVNNSVGVGPGSQDWNFATYIGNPSYPGCCLGSGAGTPRGWVRHRGQTRTGLRLAATVQLPRRLNLRRARVVVNRLLHEPRGLGELLRRPGRRLAPVGLARRGRARRGVAAFRRRLARGAGIRLLLRTRGPSQLSLVLRVRRATTALAPAACNALPAALDRTPNPTQLHTRLRIADGRHRPVVVHLKPHWRCHRDRKGVIRRLSVVRPKPPKLQRGLAVAVRRRPAAEGVARFAITVHNRRPARISQRVRSSFWNVVARVAPGPRQRLARRPRKATLRSGQAVWRIRELRRGARRTFNVSIRGPRSTRRRACGVVTVSADAARSAGGRLCTRVSGGPR